MREASLGATLSSRVTRARFGEALRRSTGRATRRTSPPPSPGGYSRLMKIARSRRRRERQPEPPPSEPVVGARTPGVQARTFREPAPDDWNARLRKRMHGGQPAPIWRPGSSRT
jgi:hypothetical protein